MSRPPRDHGLPGAGLRPVGRLSADLPGPPGDGRTPAPLTISSADDVLDVLLAFIDGVVGDQPLVVVGHSAGGSYAQAIARRLDRAGHALLRALVGEWLDRIHEHSTGVSRG